MDRHQVRYALLKISIVALALSTWVFWSFIFATRPEVSEMDALTSLVRLPASLPAQIPGIAQIPGMQQRLPKAFVVNSKLNEMHEMRSVKVGCWDGNDESEMATNARWIRLMGRACQPQSEEDSVIVRNLSNGYVATVFPAQLRNLTTDFIPLQQGKNDILIRFKQGPGGASESRFFFLRE